ncbi:FtsX-like permease family protein [Jeotgalibacillus marinus]|uniref:FtsX-like permease family protein n=1 Tax=Jeotgalibacillus marinus TaxID=86667 RepID=A0ABV3Q133_9BACL
MSFRQFAFKNVMRNKQSYSAYFLSSVFTVLIFFLYAVISFHPEINNEALPSTVNMGFVVAEFIIYFFAVFFVYYSMSTFVKNRSKEFGLLTILGITKGQLNRLVILENMMIGIGAIITGIAIGFLFSKLFLMIYSLVLALDAPISFYVPTNAIVLTISLFFILFLANSFLTLFSINKNRVLELLQGSRKPKKYPTYSWILSIMAFILIGFAYYLSFDANLRTIFFRMIPILLLVIPGTYFLFTQASIFIIRILQKRKSTYYKKTNMLTISDLSYKMKDNSSILTVVAIMTAITFTATGVLASFYFSKKDQAEQFYPDVFSISSDGSTMEQYEKEKENLNQNLMEESITFTNNEFQLLPVKISYLTDQSPTSIMSLTDFNIQAKHIGLKQLSLNEEEIFLISGSDVEGFFDFDESQVTLMTETESHTLNVKEVYDGKVINDYGLRTVVHDELYRSFNENMNPNELQRYYSVNFPNWERQEQLDIDLKQTITHPNFNSKIAGFYLLKNIFSEIFFIGFFISILFFISAGSILYFKLYNEIDRDLDHYKALSKIGLTISEMRNIASKQLAVLFFVPFLVATVHAIFAFIALQNMIPGSVWFVCTVTILSYLLIQFLYYLFILRLYVRKIQLVM